MPLFSSLRFYLYFLHRVTQETAGLYQCHVLTQSDSRAIKQTFQIIVRFGPFVWTPRSSVTLVEGDTGTLECDADGSPAPLVHWIRESPPDPLSNSTLLNGTLILFPLTVSAPMFSYAVCNLIG